MITVRLNGADTILMELGYDYQARPWPASAKRRKPLVPAELREGYWASRAGRSVGNFFRLKDARLTLNVTGA